MSKKKKITFIMPPPLDGNQPVERVFGCNYGIYPIPNIFALTSAAVLEEAGYEVRYIDGPIEGWKKEDFLNFLGSDDSDMYCFYTVNLATETDRIAHGLIRKLRGRVPVAFVGPAPTYTTDVFVLDESSFAIRGEMDLTLKELADAIFKGGDMSSIKGLSYTKGGAILNNGSRPPLHDLDSLPFPARHLIDRSRYYNPKFGVRPVTAALTSRGCPHKCIYCVPNSLSFARELEYKKGSGGTKPAVRQRSPESIQREFTILRDEGFRAVNILDDQFPWGEARTVDICERIGPLGISWGCLARADYLNENIIKAMKKANCMFVDIGAESFDEPVLEYVKKEIEIEKIEESIRLLKENHIIVKLNMLLGSSPLETKESILRNIEIVKKLDPDGVMYSLASPFPGTDFYDMAKKEGWFVHGDYVPRDVRKEAIHSYPNLAKEELEGLIRHANFSFYLRPRFIVRNLWRVVHPREFYYASRSMMKKLF